MDSDNPTGTIISACPERFHGGDESANRTLIQSITRSFEDAQTKLSEKMSPEHFVALVVQNCLSFFDDPWNAGLDNPASWLFATYIAKQVRHCCWSYASVSNIAQSDREVSLRGTFLGSLRERQTGAKAQRIPYQAKDIQDEVKCLREVKDVRDEVTMVQNVLQGQLEVFEEFLSSIKQKKKQSKSNEPREENAWNQISYDRTIYVLRQRWQRLGEDAERVEKSVGQVNFFLDAKLTRLIKLNHLLDLKQKQASLDEAASASDEAKSAAIQNRAILVFTVVTVIFVRLFPSK